MRLDHIEDDLLQRYHDGELTGGRSEQVKQHLDSCAICQKRQQSLTRLHELFAIHSEEVARDVNFDFLYSKVAAEISRQQPAGILDKLFAWWDGLRFWKPQVWAPATAVALAGITIVVLNTHWQDRSLRQVAGGQKSPGSMIAAASALGSEIIRVDFGDRPGTVFEVALAEGATTAVVWINDETDNSGMQ
jgi:anti-sigma factor RsiW